MANFHTCAADHCDAQVPTRMLMCRNDWALVPRAIQSKVYRAYRNRASTGWGPYLAAVTEAKAAVTHALGGGRG